MKGDVSRHTFDAARHYSGVRMQMGRVQLDADWNEQVDIARHRVETETLDAVGRCGGPLHDAGFRIVRLSEASTELLTALQAIHPGLDPTVDDLVILPGRYYVDGILCQCDHPVLLGRQPDLPRPPGQPAGHGLQAGSHLLYLDVWERHLTALEAPAIREVALGGPDTATRTRTVWQVKSLFLGEAGVEDCEEPPEYLDAIRPGTGRMRARARPQVHDAGPCVLPDGAGYQGLENQEYRVEVHLGGEPLDLSAPASAGSPVTGLDLVQRTVTVAGGAWSGGDWVELFATGPGSDPMEGVVAQVADVAGAGPFTLTLSGAFPAMDPVAEQPRLRVVSALWKWSRDNGTVLTRVVGLNGAEVTVESLGPDDVLGFDAGHWVELYDDLAELNGRPGQLLQVEERDPAGRILRLRTPAAPLAPPQWLAPGRTPRLRRWDGIAALKLGAGPAHQGGYAHLEDGVEVRFEAGTCRTGEYWMIPARTATAAGEGGGVEWPRESALLPAALRPLGIEHHYCRLAGVRVDGDQLERVVDCRCLFAPASELNALAYVSGAGQEALPDPLNPAFRPPLGLPLVVGVGNGHCRPGRRVRFTVMDGGGLVDANQGGAFAGDQVDVEVGGNGEARCWWKLDGVTQHQRVSARLLEEMEGGWVPVQNRIVFNASLSVAGEVAYHPRDCGTLQGRKTVRDALDRIVDLVRLYPAGGDGQETMPGQPLSQPLRVLVASTCGIVANRPAAVRFTVLSGGGTLTGGALEADGSRVVDTDAQGIASVQWTPGPQPRYQQVRATLLQPADRIAEPSRAVFGATLSVAAQVAYTPNQACPGLAQATTVQAALDTLCTQVGRGCSGLTVSPGEDWVARISAHLAQGNGGDVCFRAGTYVTQAPLVVKDKGVVVFSGAGDLSKIVCAGHERAVEFENVDTVVVRDLALEAGSSVNRPAQRGRNGTLTFRNCRSVTVEGCTLLCGPGRSRTSSCLLSTRAMPEDRRPPHAEVTVRGCTVLVSDRQVGILLVNPGRAVVENNAVRGWSVSAALTLTPLLQRDGYRRGLDLILSRLLDPERGGSSLGWRRIHQRLVPAHPTELVAALKQVPDVVDSPSQIPEVVKAWMVRLETIAAQGIVVGGTVAGDVVVRGNTVEDVVQGVHVGLSHTGASRYRADSVVVSGNTIAVRARTGVPSSPHGIFVGNAYQVMVDENRIACATPYSHGISLHGWFGPVVTVRENRTESADFGIYFNALNPVPPEPLYWAGYNAAVEAQYVVYVDPNSRKPLEKTLNREVNW